MTDESWDAIAIGAGLAGWAAAHELTGRGWRVLLLEADDRIGGRVRTIRRGDLVYEQGALFAFDPAWAPFPVEAGDRTCEERPLGVHIDGRLVTGASVPDCLLNAGADPRALLTLESALERASPRLAALGAATRGILEASFRVIHPGNLEDYVPRRRLDALTRHRIASFARGNAALIEAFRAHTPATLRTGCRVEALHPDSDGVRVVWRASGSTRQARARRVILTVPAPVAHRLLADTGARRPALAFLAGVRYGAGIVVTLVLRETGPPPCSYMLCPDDSINPWFFRWSAGPPDTLVVTACVAGEPAAALAALTDETLLARVQARLPALLPGVRATVPTVLGEVRRWPAVGPLITEAAYGDFTQACLHPLDGVVLAGDYTWWTARGMPYGMRAAIESGRRAAGLARQDPPPPMPVQVQGRPLAITQVIALTERGPRLERRVADGRVAYHGLLLAATPEDADLARYLVSECEDGLWSYQRGYGVTALDSALVMEGLLRAGGHETLLRHGARRLVEVFFDERDGGFRTIPPDRTPRARYWSGTDCPATACCAWLLWRIDPVAHAPVIAAAAHYLRNRQLIAGGWPDKWFPSATLPVYYALRLLVASGGTAPDPARARARDWLLSGQERDGSWRGSVIETAAALLALALEAALDDDGQAALRRARDWLRARGPDGTWAGEPILHYWFESGAHRTFFQTTDTGAIATAWARLALAAAPPASPN